MLLLTTNMCKVIMSIDNVIIRTLKLKKKTKRRCLVASNFSLMFEICILHSAAHMLTLLFVLFFFFFCLFVLNNLYLLEDPFSYFLKRAQGALVPFAPC